jgi:hypothetical protein
MRRFIPKVISVFEQNLPPKADSKDFFGLLGQPPIFPLLNLSLNVVQYA